MLTCKEVTVLCSLELDQPLAIREKASILAHTLMCASCARFREQMTMIHRAMETYADGRGSSGTDARIGDS